MNTHPHTDNIQRNWEQFKQLPYKDRLAFFDKEFILIPFEYPPFDPHLAFFFDPIQSDRLLSLYQAELNRKNPYIREFSDNGKNYRFDVRPLSSKQWIFNHYLITKFVTHAQDTQPPLPAAASQRQEEINTVSILLKKIRHQIDHNESNDRLIKFITVFFAGFLDYQQYGLQPPKGTRKLIELYLYTQGLLVARYLENLENLPTTDHPISAGDRQLLEQQLIAASQLGIIRYLETQVAPSPLPLTKIAHLLCLLMGGRATTYEAVQKILAHLHETPPPRQLRRQQTIISRQIRKIIDKENQ